MTPQYPTQRGTTRNTQVPQYSNYQPPSDQLNSKDPAVLKSAADEINARNAAKLGGTGEQTWWKPNAEGGGYSQVLNPTDYSGLISAQGALPEYMRTAGTASTMGSTNSMDPEVIAKMWSK